MKKYLKELRDLLVPDGRGRRKWRSFVTAMAMIVVFVTTYALILPAITLEKEEGKPNKGIYLDDMERGSTASLSKNEPDQTGQTPSSGQEAQEATEDGSGQGSSQEAVYASGVYSGKGDGYTVYLDLKEEMKFPADVSLNIEDITEDNNTAAVYRSYVTAARKAAAKAGRGEFSSIRFFKFALLSGGQEVRCSNDLDILIVPDQKDSVKNGEEAHVLAFQGSTAYMVQDLATEMSGYRVSAYRFYYPAQAANNKWGLLGLAVTGPKAEEDEDELSRETRTGDQTEATEDTYQTKSTEDADQTEATETADQENLSSEADREATATTETIESTETASSTETAGSTEEISSSTEETGSTETVSSTEETGATETAEASTETSETGRQPAGRLDFKGQDYKVVMTFDQQAGIPEGAVLQVTEIQQGSEDYEKYLKEASKSLGMDKHADPSARFFDIKIMNGDQEIKPKVPVSVNITYDQPVELKEGDKLDAIHFGEKETEVIDQVQIKTNRNDDVKSVTFDADSFSVYGLITYTVDFHWQVNGKNYGFSIPGGGYVSFAKLIEALGISEKADAQGTDETDDETEVQKSDGVTDETLLQENAADASEADADEADLDKTDVDKADAEESDSPDKAGGEDKPSGEDKTDADNTSLTLDGVTISDTTKEFLADVDKVEFSSPKLLSVSKVDKDTTVGAIKDGLGLECEYSADISKEDIEKINVEEVLAGDWALISLKSFDTEETLTVTMKDGEVFTIRVTDAQIKKTVIDAKGDTWEITVTYGEDAQIPDGAELKVEEILPEDDKYTEYYRKSLEKTGLVSTALTGEGNESDKDTSGKNSLNDVYAHIFDIEIWNGDQKIEPAADVSVSLKLLDAPENEDTDLQVVHFAKDGPEVMDLGKSEEDEKAGRSELSFVTDEFSVYTVVDAGSTNLNGQSFALVSGIANDPGATTGYSETWGTDYFTIIVNAHAVSNTVNGSGISSTGVHTWTDNGTSYAGGEVPEWTFESAGNGKYYLSVIDGDGNKRYLTRNGAYDWDARLSDTPNQYSQYTISDNGDGTALIYYDGGSNDQRYYLYNDGNGEWSTRTFKFRNTEVNTSSSAFRFKLCKKSDDFDSFAARKVAASTVTTNTNYVIYRKFTDESGNEELYALAHDGTFVRVYDGGDTVYWRETDKNIYWNYQIDGRYPVLFTQDPATQETIYINPNHSAGQTLSTTATGLTLLGRDTGEYTTAIECWDQAAYDFAGLRATNDGGTVSLSTGTRVAGTSDQFLFAVASQMPGATAETVATVDSDSLGIKITMFDYGDANNEYAAGTKLEEMTAVAGSDEYSPHAAHALVKGYLESGLPSSTSNGAMTGLFTDGGSAVTAYKENVNHLFLQSYYDENGTFRYRSEDNYAYLPFDVNSGTITGTDFTVYRQAATPYTSNISVGHTYYHHGHFMPFNDIDMNNNLSRLMNQYGNDYQNGEASGEIPLGDGRTYEDIYGTQGIPNFYTGMKMEANFTQPRDGKLDNGDEMVFKFTGDDDMWVYIDGILVLDVGGIHEPLSGTINFATGAVSNPAGSSLAGTTTLYQIFQNILTASDTPQEVKDKINAITWKDVDGDGTPDTFADYTNHSFSAFYMERGAGASNLDIQFNLKVVLTDQFTVEKEIPESIDGRFNNQTYKFQATYKDAANQERPLYAGIDGICSAVVYKDKEDDQGNPVTVPVDQDGYFYLRAGEAAVFMMENDNIQYNVKEVDLDQYGLEKITINGDEVTEHVEINDQQAAISDNAAVAGFDEVKDRSNVLYKNYPKTQNLLITKHITEDSAPLEDGENPVFEFRVYLETTIFNEDGTPQKQLVPYSYGPYYLIKEVEGETHYFTLTGENNAPVDKGTEPVVCSTTGRSGSINSIPPEYTIVIPDLVVGTNFYIEERRDNIPEGYEFVREELTEGTYDESSLIGEGASSEIINRVLARDESDLQEFDPETVGQIKDGVDARSHVYNKKLPPLDIQVAKNWEGVDPDSEDINDVNIQVTIKRYTIQDKVRILTIRKTGVPSELSLDAHYEVRNQAGELLYDIPWARLDDEGTVTTISGLPAGDYTVKEIVNSSPAGFDVTHTPETGIVEITMPDEGSVEAVFGSTFVERKHNLTIKKTISGLTNTSNYYADTSYVIRKDDEQGEIVATLSYADVAGDDASGGKTVSLREGTYFVEEINTPVIPGYTVTHSPSDNSNRHYFSLSLDEDQSVVFNSVYEQLQDSNNTYTVWHWNVNGAVNGTGNIPAGYPAGSVIRATFYFRNSGWKDRTVDGGAHPYYIYGGIRKDLIQSEGSYSDNTYCATFTTEDITLVQDGHLDVVLNTDPNGDVNNRYVGVSFELISSAQGRLQSSRLMRSLSGVRRLQTLAAAQNTSVSQTAGSDGTVNIANTAELPEIESSRKYVWDETYSETVVLTSENEWSRTLSSLDRWDENGNEYYYCITNLVETGLPEGTVAAIDTDNDGLRIVSSISDNKDLTVTNVVPPKTGSLKLTKVVHVDDVAPETDEEKNLVSGNYIFTVSSGNSIVKYVQITVSNGLPVSYKTADTQEGLASASDVTGTSAFVSGLTEGDYVITEIEKNGMILKEAARGDGNTDAVSSEKALTVHVTAGQDNPEDNSAATASFTNNIETVTAKVVKIWDHTGNNGTQPASLTVKLSNGETKELNAGNNWTAEISDLPKYDRSTGELIEYIWTEETLPAGYYLSNLQEDNNQETSIITTTLTNTYTGHYNPTTTITGNKVWDDDGINRPESITVNLYKDGTLYETITVQAPVGDSADQNQWPFEFTNLPVFNSDGSVIQYSVEEVLPEGYTEEYGINIEFSQATYTAGDATGTIVNSGEGSQTFKVSDGYDLGYIVIRHGNDFIIWTPRPATSEEITTIKAKAVSLSDQFNGITSASGESMIILSGVPKTVDVGKKHAVSVYMQDGEVWIKFLNPNTWSDFAYGIIPYTYTQAGGEGGGTITNTKKYTDIGFSKKWIDISQEEIEWKQDIQVTLSRNKADGNKDNGFSLVYNIEKSIVENAAGGTAEFSTGTETDPKLKLTIVTEGETKKYHFKVEQLPYSSETDGKYTYYVEETNEQLEGYLAPSYSNTSAPTGATEAYNDGVIINQHDGGPELPSTGGPGTRLFTILGLALVTGAGLLLWRRRRMV